MRELKKESKIFIYFFKTTRVCEQPSKTTVNKKFFEKKNVSKIDLGLRVFLYIWRANNVSKSIYPKSLLFKPGCKFELVRFDPGSKLILVPK